MSRVERKNRIHRMMEGPDADEEGIRFFIISNHPAGYAPTFSPDSPIMIWRTKKQTTESQAHPCDQWKPFADMVFNQSTAKISSLFLLDVANLPAEVLNEEASNYGNYGPALKSVRKVLLRFNPKLATVICAGPASLFALKYVLHSNSDDPEAVRCDRLIGHVILLCPPNAKDSGVVAEVNQAMKKLDAQTEGDTAAKCQCLTVLVQQASQLDSWEEIASKLDVFFVETRFGVIPEGKALFDALLPCVTLLQEEAVGDVKDGRSPAGYDPSRGMTRLLQLHFVLSPNTKQIEQQVAPLESSAEFSNPPDTTTQHHNPSAGKEEVTATSLMTVGERIPLVRLVELRNLSNTKVKIHGVYIGESGTNSVFIGNHEGQIEVNDSTLTSLRRGDCVELIANMNRCKGFYTLIACHIKNVTEEAHSIAENGFLKVSKIPKVNHSSVQHYSGCLLFRGAKVVLSRSKDGKVKFPFALHNSIHETSLECAINAVCQQCDITPDNFYPIPNVSNIDFYPQVIEAAPMSCVTLYLCQATYPAPAGVSSDFFEDELDPTDSYDWCSFAQCMQLLSTKQEQEFVQLASHVLKNAQQSNLYSPGKYGAIFGQSLFKSTLSSSHEHTRQVPGNQLILVTTPLASSVDEANTIAAEYFANICHNRSSPKKSPSPFLIPLFEMPQQEIRLCVEQYIRRMKEQVGEKSSVVTLCVLPYYLSTEILSEVFAPVLEFCMPADEVCLVSVIQLNAVNPSLILQPCCTALRAMKGLGNWDSAVISSSLQNAWLDAVRASDVVALSSPANLKQCGQEEDCCAVISSLHPTLPIQSLKCTSNAFHRLPFEILGESNTSIPPSPRLGIYQYFRSQSFDAQKLTGFLSSVKDVEKLLRQLSSIVIRGVCWLDQCPNHRGILEQRDGVRLTLSKGEPWATTPDEDTQGNWHEEFGERCQHIIVISSVPSSPLIEGQLVQFLDSFLISNDHLPTTTATRVDSHVPPWHDDEFSDSSSSCEDDSSEDE